MSGGERSHTDQLIDLLASLENRPYDYTMTAWPWGEEGTELAERDGPEPWQTEVLRDLQSRLLLLEAGEGAASPEDWSRAVGSCLVAIKSGKNVGKTALLSWIVWWAFSTRSKTKGRATANTEKQLRQILWTELAKWHRLSIFSQFFKMTATQVYSADPLLAREWHFDAVPWSEDNPDAWAGLHNQGGRILQIFDEASGIHDSIWERADGATREANTQVIWVCTSNPTKNTGRFYECFHKFSELWMTYTVDSREVSLTDHEAINNAIRLWGEDDDYVKMSFLGEFPSTSMTQLIAVETIRDARTREVQSQSWEPLILSVDVARFGGNENVAVLRRGRDARTLPCHRWRGLTVPETGNRIASLIATHNPDGVFIDEGGVGGGVVDFVRHLGHSCVGVNFGGSAAGRPDGVLVANKRAEMFVALREWLRTGGCIENSEDLAEQLVSIEYKFDKKQQILLMSKEDMRMLGRPSPDWADALAMSFAFPVAARSWTHAPKVKVDYDPFGPQALPKQDAPAMAGEWR